MLEPFRLFAGGRPLAAALKGFLLFGLFWGLAAALIASYVIREQAGATIDTSRTIASLLAQNLARSFDAAQLYMDNLSEDVARLNGPGPVHELLKRQKLPQGAVQLSVVDPAGLFVASNLAPAAPGSRTDLTDREHIKVHLDNPSSGTFISRPVLGRVSNQWTVQISRAYRNPEDQSIRFMMVTSYSVASMTELYRGIVLDPRMLIAVPGMDGYLRFRSSLELLSDQSIANTPSFNNLTLGPSGVYNAPSAIDGIERRGYYTRVPGYPLIALAAREKSADTIDVLPALSGLGVAALLLALASSLGLVAMGSLVRSRMEQNKAQALQRDSDLLEGLSSLPGLYLFASGDNGIEARGKAAAPEAAWVRESLDRFVTTGPGRGGNHVDTFQAGDVARTLVWRSIPVATPEGERKAYLAYDSTEQANAERATYELSKLATLGEMSTGLAHELAQPLSIISLSAASVRRMLEPLHLDEANERLARINRQIDRTRSIINHMRLFGRKDGGDRLSAPQAALEGLALVVSEDLRLAGIDLRCTAAPGLPNCAISQTQLEQVLLNLIVNARYAIMDRAARERDCPRWISVTCTLAEEPDRPGQAFVAFVVEDTGGGVPPEVRPRMFVPFFTTKPVGKGTGLGLSVSFGIVRDHDGAIRYEDGAEGAVFRFLIPVAEAAGAAPPVQAVA
jgi:signal transduction histidine kinase